MATILLVDDDPIFNLLTRRRLERAGHAVTVIDGALGVMSALKGASFDLLLLDIFMPGLSGVDLVRMIRSRETLAPLKIVLHSSADEDRLAALAAQLEVDGHVRKSGTMTELLDVIDAVLGRSSGP